MKLKHLYHILNYGMYKRNFNYLTSPLRALPDFIVIGAKRCGTTSLYYYFGQHPSINSSAHDKLGFFDDNFELGINWYKSHFPIQKRNFLTYDVTATYIQSANVAKRIKKLLPNVKLIAILRNPIDRAFSEYNETVRENSEKLSFEDAITFEMNEQKNPNSKNYLTKGKYANQLTYWYEIFPKKQLLIISAEDLQNNTQNTLQSIFQFLNLPNYSIKDIQKRNVGKYLPMKTETRKKLIDYFKPYNEDLYKLIDKHFDWNR